MYLNNSEWLLARVFPSLTWSVPTREKEIYLTFDDGPVPEVTDLVLEELSSRNVEATFFCVGDNVRKHDSIFKKVILAGHGYANHTFNHLDGWRNDVKVYLENIALCDDIMRQAGGEERAVKLFRPPYGKITRQQVSLLKNDYKIVMWNCLTGDFDKKQSPEACLKTSIKYTKSGSIVIFHDSIKAEKSLRYALPRFLDHFLEKGFVFKKL